MSDGRQSPDFVLRLRALTGPGWEYLPAEQRLRALLKRALRSHGLSCVSCRPVDTGTKQISPNEEAGGATTTNNEK